MQENKIPELFLQFSLLFYHHTKTHMDTSDTFELHVRYKIAWIHQRLSNSLVGLFYRSCSGRVQLSVFRNDRTHAFQTTGVFCKDVFLSISVPDSLIWILEPSIYEVFYPIYFLNHSQQPENDGNIAQLYHLRKRLDGFASVFFFFLLLLITFHVLLMNCGILLCTKASASAFTGYN